MAHSPKDLDGLSVLVVDDERDARECVAQLLRLRGAEVHQADAPLSALAFLAMHTPDVMISDIVMPGGDGYALMRRVRSLGHKQKRTIPAIALTAFAREVDRARALGAGFDVHMPKPLEPAVLMQTVLDLARTRSVVDRAGRRARQLQREA
jgi:CheY-like chemotaxis protein